MFLHTSQPLLCPRKVRGGLPTHGPPRERGPCPWARKSAAAQVAGTGYQAAATGRQGLATGPQVAVTVLCQPDTGRTGRAGAGTTRPSSRLSPSGVVGRHGWMRRCTTAHVNERVEARTVRSVFGYVVSLCFSCLWDGSGHGAVGSSVMPGLVFVYQSEKMVVSLNDASRIIGSIGVQPVSTSDGEVSEGEKPLHYLCVFLA